MGFGIGFRLMFFGMKNNGIYGACELLTKTLQAITKGVYMHDHEDTAKLTTLLKIYTLGHDFILLPFIPGD